MLRPRVIPVLTMDHLAMVKTQRFAKPTYLGDPINAVRVLDTKEVDELIVLDITASRDGRTPDPTELVALASEAFMPVCYGGGIASVASAEAVLRCGFEKVAVNTAAQRRPALIGELAEHFGSQAVVASIDVDQGRRRHVLRSPLKHAERELGTPIEWARRVVDEGAGEILLMAANRDGTAQGYDLPLIREVSQAVDVPVLAVGGAGEPAHLADALSAGAAGAAAGRLFFTRGPHLAALVSYPTPQDIEALSSVVHGDG